MKNPVAEIIAIGSELTTGAKLDTNSQWLSLALAELGISTIFHSTIADDQPIMETAMRDAGERSEYVFITGGLGPTLDDITRQALAGLSKTELVLNEKSLEYIRGLFTRRNRHMPERNEIQAMFPQGSEPINNPRGTAPGIWFEVPRTNGNGQSCFIAMPGVPSEMKRMFEQEVVPRLPSGQQFIRRARMNCFGLGESTAEEMLGNLTARGRDPEVGITVHEATITLRITAHGTSEADCQEKISDTQSEIHSIMGDHVFGEEDEELHHIVVRLLNERRLSLATVESGTGGLLAHRLTDCNAANDCYRGGIVVPDNNSRRRFSSEKDNENDDPRFENWNSSETARLLVENCRQQFGTDFALSITECPIFNPDAATDEAPRTFAAFSGEHGTDVVEISLFGDPAITKSRVAKAALNLLRLHLIR